MPRQIGLLTIVTVVHVGLLFVQHDQAGTAIYCARNKKNKKAKREHQANLQLYREPSIIAASHYRNACASSTKHSRTHAQKAKSCKSSMSLALYTQGPQDARFVLSTFPRRRVLLFFLLHRKESSYLLRSERPRQGFLSAGPVFRASRT